MTKRHLLPVALLLLWPALAAAKRVVVVPTDQHADAAAREVIRVGREAIAKHGRFNLVLSGGSTPKAMHQRLASPELQGQLDWEKVHIYFGDERSVARTHADSNYKMAKDTLLDHVPIPTRNVHRIRGEWSPLAAARAYARQLSGRRLDLVLLGMGDDGHTASLFPGMKLDATEAAIATESPAGPRQRVSLSLDKINQASNVLFLVSGAAKAGRVAEVLGGHSKLPSAQVKPAGSLTWLLDQGAAGSQH